MGILSKIFGNKQPEEKTGGMQDYMTLVRVYFQASMAAQLGITNLAMLPDLRMFKTTLRVPTQNNKLGVGEKAHCKKMMHEIYQSVRKNCKKLQDAQVYLVQFQNFSQDLMMLIGNLMKFKLRVPAMFGKVIYTMTEKTVSDIFTKNNFSDAGTVKTVMGIRQYNQRLGFSQQWVTNFAYRVVMLAKKEPTPAQQQEEATRKGQKR